MKQRIKGRTIMKSVRSVIVILFVLGCTLWVLPFALAQKADSQPVAKSVSQIKEVQGEVSAITGNFISVIYKRDAKGEYEMAFPIDKAKILLDHVQSLDQIHRGDTVSVQYEELTQQTSKSAVVKHIAKKIFFLKGSTKPEEPPDNDPTPEPGEPVAQE